MHKIKDMLMKELMKYEEKGNISMNSLDVIHKMTDTIKNIDKIEMLEGDDSYSRAGGWEARGTYGRYNDGGNSYARRGQHYVRGHYSRDSGMVEELENLKRRLPGQEERETVQRLIDEMKNR